MEDVNRIEGEKALAKLKAEQEKALAESKKAENEKLVEPIEFKAPEDDLGPQDEKGSGSIEGGPEGPTAD